MSADAWTSGFVLATGTLTAAGLELAAYRRRAARRRARPDIEPVPWAEMEHYR